MQVADTWRPPTGTLGELVAATGDRVRALHERRGPIERAAAVAEIPPSFVAALGGATVALIAEVKRRSPSKGLINAGLDAAEQAQRYVEGGAAAVSVLTEPTRFGGSAEDIVAVRRRVTAPVLRKDFLIDELQLVEARAIGASAVLLIVRALPPQRLTELASRARGLALEPLVEVRDLAELDHALAAGARVIGVNNRDLETLEVDPLRALTLIPRIPAAILAVAESGVEGRPQVVAAAGAGADAVLVGSALSGAADPGAAVAGLVGVPRDRLARGGAAGP